MVHRSLEKIAALVLAAAVSTEAFGPFGAKKAAAPAPVKEAPKAGKSIAARVFEMDLFAPVKDQNDYGARGRKNLKQGTISAGSSYIPSGLSADEYNKIRKDASVKKEANYQRNVAKAGKFLDYTKVGAPLNIMVWIIATLVIPLLFPF